MKKEEITVDGVKVSLILGDDVEMDDPEVKHYVTALSEKYSDRTISKIKISLPSENGCVDTETHFKPLPSFARIRRITGYLSGTLDRFNNAKKAEVRDRVKHSTDEEVNS